MSNTTCFSKHAPLKEPPLIQNGQLKFQAHHVGWIIATFFTLVACIVSIWLTIKHLTWYTNKRQQRYIVRLLFMVPIYASVSLASYIFWNHAIPITLARDSYEAFVLYCFFYLLLQYLSPTAEGQKDVFRRVTLEKWVFPFGFVKYRPEDGLYFLQLMKWGMLQYCVVRPTTTLAAVILDSVGLYCDSSWSPGWGHVYVTVIVSASVTVAMYCLIQLYVPVATQLAPYKPLLKLFSVKAVVFLTFWQATGLSLLAMFGVVKDTNYMTANDINTGIAALLETFEMMCFAFLHTYAFSYTPYREGKKLSDRTPCLRSLMHALDLRDLWREFRDGTVYIGKTMRGVEVDEEARRRNHFAEVMGRERELLGAKEPKCDWTAGDVGEDDMFLDSPKLKTGHNKIEMWLSDPSERFGGAFQDEVERELRKRELNKEYLDHYNLDPEGQRHGHRRERGSWWRSVYDVLFHNGSDRASEDILSPVPRKPSRIRRSRKHYRDDSQFPTLDSPPPPANVMFEYAPVGQGRSTVRLTHFHKRTNETWESQGGDDASYNEHRLKSSTTGLPRGNHSDRPSAESEVLPRMIFAPRPVSTSQISDIESLVLEDEKPLPMIPSTAEHGSNRLVPSSSVLRSDSLLARVFSSSLANTVDGHFSSENKFNPASSQDTHSTGQIFPQAVSSLPIGLVLSGRDRGGEPYAMPIVSDDIRPTTHMQILPSFSTSASASREAKSPPIISPMHSRPRPDIILPVPLSPARYPMVSTRHGNSPLQHAPPPRLPLMQTKDDDDVSHHPHHSNMNPSSRRHSVQIGRPLARQRATKRRSAPIGYVDAPINTQFATDFRGENTVYRTPLDILQEKDSELFIDGCRASEHPQLPDSPNRSGSAPLLTSTPSTPPARTLRHAGDDISKARRPWP